MIRQMIKIDEEKCNGCGLCVNACHEGALKIEAGKAKLIRDDYCDGLGNCLPVCPMDAISFEQREALPYDEEAVIAKMQTNQNKSVHAGSSCPGSKVQVLEPMQKSPEYNQTINSELRQWPVQIKLLPPQAQFFHNADLLVAADCCAYAYGNFHQDFIKNKVTVIGCPKLDSIDYSEKLTEIFKYNEIKSITVTRMIVPCCTGIEVMVRKALENSGKNIPLTIKIISTDGKIALA